MRRRQRESMRGLRWGEGHWQQRGPTSVQARWWDGERYRARTFRGPTLEAAIEQAEDHIRQMARRLRRGQYIAPADLTVADLIEQWLERGQHRWKPNTYHTYQSRAERYVVPALGAVPVLELEAPRVQHWIDQLVRDGHSPAMVGALVHILRAAYREAQRIGYVQHSPVTSAQLPHRRRGSMATWSEQEAAAVLRSLEDPLWQALYRLALTTGMRPGELRALRWADIDRGRSLVTVRRTMSRSAEGRITVGETTKTGRERTITLTASTLEALQAWRHAQLEQRLQAASWHDGDYVFTDRRGKPLAQVTWQREHARIIHRAGVGEIRIHDLRHTAATILMRRGLNPRVVADMLGHASVQTTLDVYSHVDEGQQRTAAEALERAISG